MHREQPESVKPPLFALFVLAYLFFSVASVLFYHHIKGKKLHVRAKWRALYEKVLLAHRLRVERRWRRFCNKLALTASRPQWA